MNKAINNIKKLALRKAENIISLNVSVILYDVISKGDVSLKIQKWPLCLLFLY